MNTFPTNLPSEPKAIELQNFVISTKEGEFTREFPGVINIEIGFEDPSQGMASILGQLENQEVYYFGLSD